MSPVLLLVGEDHRRATHAISRVGWLTIAQNLINSDNPEKVKVLRVLEESPNRAKQRNLLGYGGVIGLETEMIFSSAYKRILTGILNTFPPNQTADELKGALLATFDCSKYGVSVLKDIGTTYQDAKKIVKEMDLHDLQFFFGVEGKGVLEKWFASLNKDARNGVIRQFCNDQLLYISYSSTKIDEMLTDSKESPFYDKLLFITDGAIHGSAKIRHRENPMWVDKIRKVAASEQPGIVIVFIGNEHLRDVKAIELIDGQEKFINHLGLIDLFEKNLAPFEKMYVASNIKSEMPSPPDSSPSYSSDGDGDSDASITSLPSDSEDEGLFANESFYIEQMMETLNKQNRDYSLG